MSKALQLFLSFTILIANAQAGENEQCEFRLKQDRDQSYQLLSLAQLNEFGKFEDAGRDFQFGYEYKKQMSDSYIQKVCKDKEFRSQMGNILHCTGQIYSKVAPESIPAVEIEGKSYLMAYKGLPVSKWKVFSYCKAKSSKMSLLHHDIDQTAQCLEQVKNRIQHNNVLSVAGQSVLNMARNYDEVFEYCQKPAFRSAFLGQDMVSVSSCYQKKMVDSKLFTEFHWDSKNKDFVSPSLVKSKFKKHVQKFNLESWAKQIQEEKLYDDFVAPAILTYTQCGDSYLKGKQLHAFYNDHAFVNCVHQSGAETTEAKEESCAQDNHLLAREEKWIKSNNSRGRSIASDGENEESSWFGDWQKSGN